MFTAKAIQALIGKLHNDANLTTSEKRYLNTLLQREIQALNRNLKLMFVE